jgi:hypothetical protein
VEQHTDTFSKKNRITIDLLGHGETECLGYIHSMEDNADAVHASLSCTASGDSRWPSHGRLCSWLSPIVSENVKALVLLNSTARADVVRNEN